MLILHLEIFWKNMKLLIINLIFLAAMCSCTSCNDDDFTHIECNGVYYWKTILELGHDDYRFMDRHHIDRIYLRMFDVTAENRSSFCTPFEAVVPNASMRMSSCNYKVTVDSLNSKLLVPVVYITVEALKAAKGCEGQLASRIVERVRRMCGYNDFIDVEGLQLDCDWTALTEKSFFALCDSARVQIAHKELQWSLSSTIRLHQLERKAPPVDYGVLMVYNTGNFSDPDAKNSIISIDDVEKYLSHLDDYPLHLDVAYPSYSWQLLFRKRQFMGLLNGVNVADTSRFATFGTSSHRALCDIIHKDIVIRKGDIVRTEKSVSDEVLSVKAAIERRISKRPHSNIIYHLDQQNLSKYTADEIDKIYSTDSNN